VLKVRRLFVLAGLASFAACGWAQPASDFAGLLHERLKASPVLKGQFEQTKTLKGFKNPLVSRGQFLVARGQGVWWHTQQPFESTLVVTKTRLFTRNPDGSTNNLITKPRRSNPLSSRTNWSPVCRYISASARRECSLYPGTFEYW